MCTSWNTVFLGGSCNPTTWRQDIAIPRLQKFNITYYNPQVDDWKPELIEIEHNAKEHAQILFFVIDNQTRSTVSMVEAAFFSGKSAQLILVLLPSQRIFSNGEVITHIEYQSLKRSQELLLKLVKKQKLHIFESIESGLDIIPKLVKVQQKVMLRCRLRNTLKGTYTGENVSKILRFPYLKKWLQKSKGPFIRNNSLKNNEKPHKYRNLSKTCIDISYPIRDIFLAGPNVNNWRTNIAIPLLNKNGVTYNYGEDNKLQVDLESFIKSFGVLLLVIPQDTPALAEMILAAYYLGLKCNMVLCIQQLSLDCTLEGHKLSEYAIKDYNRGRSYLNNMATKIGVPVHKDIKESILCCIERVTYRL